MKPKLLISMGCSWTEGVGCYDPNTIPPNVNENNFLGSREYKDIFIKNSNRFHELGWPNRLGKKLGYDKVINLGTAGSSNSGQLKLFTEKYLEKDLSEYDVLIVWYLTESARFSFYSGGYNKNFTFSDDAPIEKAYLNMLEDVEIDTSLEQIFYMKLMEQICENKGYNLLFTSWLSSNINLYYQSKYFLSPGFKQIIPTSDTDEYKKYKSILCAHPNEKGYQIISDKIYNEIKQNHSYLIANPPKETIEWEWDGYHKVYTTKTIM